MSTYWWVPSSVLSWVLGLSQDISRMLGSSKIPLNTLQLLRQALEDDEDMECVTWTWRGTWIQWIILSETFVCLLGRVGLFVCRSAHYLRCYVGKYLPKAKRPHQQVRAFNGMSASVSKTRNSLGLGLFKSKSPALSINNFQRQIP